MVEAVPRMVTKRINQQPQREKENQHHHVKMCFQGICSNRWKSGGLPLYKWRLAPASIAVLPEWKIVTLFAERFASCVELTPFNEKHKSPSSQSRTGVKERNLDYSSRSVQKMSEYKNSRILFYFLGNNRRGGSFSSFVGFPPETFYKRIQVGRRHKANSRRKQKLRCCCSTFAASFWPVSYLWNQKSFQVFFFFFFAVCFMLSG